MLPDEPAAIGYALSFLAYVGLATRLTFRSSPALADEWEQEIREAKRRIVAIGYGNSDNLDWDVDSTQGAPGIIGGLVNFLWLAFRHSGEHLLYLVKISAYFLATGLRSVVAYLERLTRTVGPNDVGRRDGDAIKRT